jgi:hypothetical protein
MAYSLIRKTMMRAWAWGVLFVSSSLMLLTTTFTIFREFGFYFTIAAVAVAVSFFVAVVCAIGESDIQHSRYRAQKRDLDSLRSLQDSYLLTDHDGNGQVDSIYADGLSKLPQFEARNGVQVAITHGSRNGWSAISSHKALAGNQG